MIHTFLHRPHAKIGGALLLVAFIGVFSVIVFNKALSFSALAPQVSARPNILFILTDDQDLASLQYMPKLQEHLVGRGTSFANYIDNYALCCVTRASILRGQYANNTDIKGNEPPNGGFVKFYQAGLESETLGTWFKDWGYTTAFIGKYLNGYGKTSEIPETYVPQGWDEWRATFTQDVYDYDMNENGTVVHYGNRAKDFKTDVLADRAVSFLEKRTSTSTPFFMYLAPLAPHAPATPAPRHAGMFADLQVPRTESFNEADVSDKPLWVQQPAVVVGGVTSRTTMTT
jgi:arylsulfatase A-like enzyme